MWLTNPAMARTRTACPFRPCRFTSATARNRRSRPMVCSTTIRRRLNARLYFRSSAGLSFPRGFFRGHTAARELPAGPLAQKVRQRAVEVRVDHRGVDVALATHRNRIAEALGDRFDGADDVLLRRILRRKRFDHL